MHFFTTLQKQFCRFQIRWILLKIDQITVLVRKTNPLNNKKSLEYTRTPIDTKYNPLSQ